MHPSEIKLSLFAGGDLDVLERWRIGRHVRQCTSCAAALRNFRTSTAVLAGSVSELPPGLRWDQLAAEMTGNIRVGLAAAQCIGGVSPRRHRNAWLTAALVGPATALLFAAWFLNIPKPAAVQRAGVALQKTESGIQMREGSGALTLLHTRASSPVISSSSPGQLRSRYVDAETNQVTINNVYAQ